MTATRLRLSSRGREGRGIHSGFLIPQRGTPIVYSSYDTPEPVAIAGMNGDNLGDMVTLHGGWVQAGVYLQEEGALGPESLFPIPVRVPLESRGIRHRRCQREGKPDIAVADCNNGLVEFRQHWQRAGLPSGATRESEPVVQSASSATRSFHDIEGDTKCTRSADRTNSCLS
jgi:hypothetical protein